MLQGLHLEGVHRRHTQPALGQTVIQLGFVCQTGGSTAGGHDLMGGCGMCCCKSNSVCGELGIAYVSSH